MKLLNLLFGVAMLIPIGLVISNAYANSADSELLEAAQAGDVSRVERALDQGANIEAKNEMGATALMWAAVNGHDAVVSLLIKRGANVNAKTATRATALKGAATQGHADTVRLLLEKGADANAKDNQGQTALDAARGAGQNAVATILEGAVRKSRSTVSSAGDRAESKEQISVVVGKSSKFEPEDAASNKSALVIQWEGQGPHPKYYDFEKILDLVRDGYTEEQAVKKLHPGARLLVGDEREAFLKKVQEKAKEAAKGGHLTMEEQMQQMLKMQKQLHQKEVFRQQQSQDKAKQQQEEMLRRPQQRHQKAWMQLL